MTLGLGATCADRCVSVCPPAPHPQTLTHFNTESVAGLAIPVPPFEEQHRIIAKVDQLIALCDALEAKLNQAWQQSETLMEASVRQLLVA